jgi:pyruvate,water dikinase
LQIADGRLQIEKAAPISIDESEREKVRQEEMAALAAKAEPGGTVWSRYNLAEILPEPTPMTWAIVRRFMSGQGGFGLMYRDLGFEPDPALDEEGIYDLVCGRPYCNLSREPRMQNRHVPFEHPFVVLKADPAKALYPQPRLNPGRAGPMFWLLLPWLTFKLFRSSWKLSSLSRTLAHQLRDKVFPAFEMETQEDARQDLSSLEPSALLERLEYWIRRTLHDFARDSLKPTVLAAVALGNLERGLRALGPERIRSALSELSMGARPDPEADLPGALRELAAARLSRAHFLKSFGHRGRQEMELAQPRWAEQQEDRGLRIEDRKSEESPLVVPALAGNDDRLKAELPTTLEPRISAWERTAAEAKLSGAQRALLEPELERLHTYLGLRETAKHYLMKGYALIRRFLVELDRRYHLDGGIFCLIPEELPRLVAGEDLSALIEQRRHRRTILLSLEVPQVLFSDDLEAIGRPTVTADAETLQGVPLSAGIAEGPALVLQTPNIPLSDGAANDQGEGYILVCPSTDPAWVPLFVRARGLVMETGGVLSHGAIVAREFGLPAVAGLPDVHRRLKTGQRLRVDGALGTVRVLS